MTKPKEQEEGLPPPQKKHRQSAANKEKQTVPKVTWYNFIMTKKENMCKMLLETKQMNPSKAEQIKQLCELSPEQFLVYFERNVLPHVDHINKLNPQSNAAKDYMNTIMGFDLGPEVHTKLLRYHALFAETLSAFHTKK